jgi:hypothetical protein
MPKPFARRRWAALAAVVAMVAGTAAVQVISAGPAAAIPGLRTVSFVGPPQSDSSAGVLVNCPDGLQVIGGGAILNGNTSDKVFLTASAPLEGGKVWWASAAEVAPGWDGIWSITGYATCATPLPGWELRYGNSGPGAATFKTSYTTTCTGHKKVFSAGAEINAPTGQVGLTTIRPDGPLTIGRASARVAPGGFWDDWSVTSIAICANPVPGQQNLSEFNSDAVAFVGCTGRTTMDSYGGGGGLIDLGPYYLQALGPNGGGLVYVKMTGNQPGGVLAQTVCSD